VVVPFRIEPQWPTRRHDPRDLVDATFCSLRIRINDENATSYQTEAGVEEDHVELPAYYLAEWVAENWWALLWEPAKGEDGGDEDFRSRHSICAAEHGFILPNLNIVPAGESVRLYGSARSAKYADARFRRIPETSVDRQIVESALRDFVTKTVARVSPDLGSPLQAAWSLVEETSDDETDFCRLIGALGLSPYDEHAPIERALDSASKVLKDQQLLDLCLTATADNIVKAAYVAAVMHGVLDRSQEIDLAAMPPPPAEQPGLPPWKYGYQAARMLRSHMSVGDKDIDGAAIIFDRLHVDPAAKPDGALSGVESPILIGGTSRRESTGRMVLGPTAKQSRKFAAARATYFFLTGKNGDQRLITNAVTPDQQASRAFAAELLVPQTYIRARGDGGRLKWDKVNAIAQDAGVSADVIKLQASNIGFQVE
jgi:hypothetical protein